ncbi:MAG: hypothetical protein GWO08_01700, partial [Gammaproteobacteria bacterium]|nr:hypothetical protein [Gammaproteobacteria bacterium]
FHLMHTLHQVQAVGADQGTRYQKTNDGGQLYLVADLENNDGKPENYGNIL